MFPLGPPCLTGQFKMVLILSTCRKRSQMHKQIQLPSSVLSLLHLRRFHQHSKRKVCAPFQKIEDRADIERAAASSSATLSPIPQEYTSGLSLLTGSVILAMICAIFAGVVLAIFLFYRRKILHYGREKMASNVEKERRMSLVLTLQPSGCQPNPRPYFDASKFPALFASVSVIGIITVSPSTPRIYLDS